MKNKAISALIEIGISANTLGFRYIVDAMCVMEEDEYYIYGKTTALYEKIAKRNNTSFQSVERTMRNAFSNALKTGNPVAIDKYLSRSKPTTGNLLSILFLRISQEV